MKKLKLNIDELAIESFQTTTDRAVQSAGTVFGYIETGGGGSTLIAYLCCTNPASEGCTPTLPTACN